MRATGASGGYSGATNETTLKLACPAASFNVPASKKIQIHANPNWKRVAFMVNSLGLS
jgi:hypothetical protein